jgi:hypothetical protein
LGTTSVSPSRTAASACWESGPVAVASGQAVVEIDAILADTELAQGDALCGEVLLIGRAPGIPDQHATRDRTRLSRLAASEVFAGRVIGVGSTARTGRAGIHHRPAAVRGGGRDTEHPGVAALDREHGRRDRPDHGQEETDCCVPKHLNGATRDRPRHHSCTEHRTACRPRISVRLRCANATVAILRVQRSANTPGTPRGGR